MGLVDVLIGNMPMPLGSLQRAYALFLDETGKNPYPNQKNGVSGFLMRLGKSNLIPHSLHGLIHPLGQQAQGIPLPVSGANTMRDMTKDSILDGVKALDSA